MGHPKTAQNKNIYFEEEDENGNIPAQPAPQAMRWVSDDIEGSYDTIANDTKLPGRNPERDERGTDSSTGNFTLKFAPFELDRFFEAVLCSEGWVKNEALSTAEEDVFDLKPGAKQRSFYMLKEFTQEPARFQLFRGLQVNSLNVQYAVKSLVNCQFNFMGANNPKLEETSPIDMGGKLPAATTKQFTTLSGFLKFKGPDESDPVEFIDCSECSFVINNNMSSLEGLFQREAIDKSLGMLDITGSITEYVDTGKLYNLAKEGASGELHVMLSRGDYSYELIARISFDNSTLSGDSQLSVALPFKTYGEDRFTIRKSVPAAPPVAVTGVSLNENTLTLSVGDTDTLIATVQPADASNRNVAWESDDTDIATVDASGLVEAIAAGVANITVTTDDGGFTDTCEVTVS